MKTGLPLGARKSLDICLYLFQTLQLEAKRLTPGEAEDFQKLISSRYMMSEALAAQITSFLRSKR